jgi:hypothetical protein
MIGFSLIIVVSGTVSYVHLRLKRASKGVNPDRAKRMEARLDTLEQRLTDIQDIIIAIDEKLNRADYRPPSPVQTDKG